jgi:hypothetical protein
MPKDSFAPSFAHQCTGHRLRAFGNSRDAFAAAFAKRDSRCAKAYDGPVGPMACKHSGTRVAMDQY